MNEQTAAKLREINRKFYDGLAQPFTQTRQRPHDGFFELLNHFPEGQVSVLDVGCGNGRYGYFIEQHDRLLNYTGVDFSVGLLENRVELTKPATFREGDMSQPGFLDGLGQFDVVSCMAAIHHLPGRANRVRFLQELKEHLKENGRLIISAWQPIDSERQRRKIRDWSEVDINPANLEPNDYLLTWKYGGFAYRYVNIINEEEMTKLTGEAGLTLLHQFRMDGKEGNLSLYNVISH
ncbi:MAG: class I SAM-dependent methyltransferase [Chloroflexota bacterium]